MMMTQKKLLVSGKRWQVGKRRNGKPSSSVFGQAFTSLWLHELGKNDLQHPSPVDFFFLDCLTFNWVVQMENTFLSSVLQVID